MHVYGMHVCSQITEALKLNSMVAKMKSEAKSMIISYVWPFGKTKRKKKTATTKKQATHIKPEQAYFGIRN